MATEHPSKAASFLASAAVASVHASGAPPAAAAAAAAVARPSKPLCLRAAAASGGDAAAAGPESAARPQAQWPVHLFPFPSGPGLLASYQGLAEALEEFPEMFLSSCKHLLGKMRLIYLTSAYPTLKGQKEHTILCTKRSTTLRTPLSSTHSAGSRSLGLAKHVPLSGPSFHTGF
eukprot:1141000-Pelagomonas_calceolata.AAC.3